MTDYSPFSTRRGFAGWSVQKRKEVATLGGRSLPREKRAFAQDPDLARRAGRAGGHRRREATPEDMVLMRQSAAEPFVAALPLGSRLGRRVNRLLKLGYWKELAAGSPRERRFRLTEAGRRFLADHVETP